MSKCRTENVTVVVGDLWSPTDPDTLIGGVL